jgi:pimeloyl-ACP methyl ester carboxylesterase
MIESLTLLVWLIIYLAIGMGIVLIIWRTYAYWVHKGLGVGDLKYLDYDIPKKIQLTDCNLHYYQKGSGPDLLLIHGIGASSYVWRKVYQRFSEEFRVTAIDIPGFGRSDFIDVKSTKIDLDTQSKRLLEFLTKLNIDQTNILASSMGGALAMWMAKIDPDRIDRIVAISPAINHKVALIAPQYLKWLFQNVRPWMVTPAIVNHFVKLVRATPSSTEESMQYYLPYHIQDHHLNTFFQSLSTIADRRLPQDLKSIDTPIRVLYGRKDSILPYRFYERAMGHLPKIDWINHETGGHHLMEDDPNWVIEKTREFLF